MRPESSERGRLQSALAGQSWSWAEVAVPILAVLIVAQFSSVDGWREAWIPVVAGVWALLVWHFGVLTAYRYIWVIPEQEQKALQKQIDDLTAEAARHKAFGLQVDTGRAWILWPDDSDEEAPLFWVVCEHVVLTNTGDELLPLDACLHWGVTTDGAMRLGSISTQAGMPATLFDGEMTNRLDGQVRAPRLVNLPARHAVALYFTFDLSHPFSPPGRPRTGKELWERFPFWLEFKNKITNQSKLYPLNSPARSAPNQP